MGKEKFGVTNENLQARLRAIFLMAYSNRSQSLLLGTSNKSEMAVGYATLYGDLCGALEPIGDLFKTEVYKLAGLINREKEIIPHEILNRPPSAELRPGQKDADSLPPYETLDPIVRRLVEGQTAPRGELERKILSMLMKSEFKRWQAPPILKVSDHAFGRGRRFPVASRARE
jgi:NAD+ synthase (glutamine-hydrolysing)